MPERPSADGTAADRPMPRSTSRAGATSRQAAGTGRSPEPRSRTLIRHRGTPPGGRSLPPKGPDFRCSPIFPFRMRPPPVAPWRPCNPCLSTCGRKRSSAGLAPPVRARQPRLAPSPALRRFAPARCCGRARTSPPSRRKAADGIVFQSHALFPRMTAAKNPGYALKVRRARRDRAAGDAADPVSPLFISVIGRPMAEGCSSARTAPCRR